MSDHSLTHFLDRPIQRTNTQHNPTPCLNNPNTSQKRLEVERFLCSRGSRHPIGTIERVIKKIGQPCAWVIILRDQQFVALEDVYTCASILDLQALLMGGIEQLYSVREHTTIPGHS